MRNSSALFNFNPHSHAGSDVVCVTTLYFYIYFNPHSHAGSDFLNVALFFLPPYFNPHSHAGSDFNEFEQQQLDISISIHTPTQGVTEKQLADQQKIIISIHTPTQGVTRVRTGGGLSGNYFNPHSHAGSDFQPVKSSFAFLHFNPHSHAGSDCLPSDLVCLVEISIHTPTQGVTSVLRPVSPFCPDFNPHSHAGSDQAVRCVIICPHGFQSTLPRRE